MPTIDAIVWNKAQWFFKFGKNVCNGRLPDPEEEPEHLAADAGLIP